MPNRQCEVAGSQAANNINAAMIRINLTKLVYTTLGCLAQGFSGFDDKCDCVEVHLSERNLMVRSLLPVAKRVPPGL